MQEPVYEQLTLFQEDSPASRFPWLESKKVKGTTVTCGRKCSELSGNLDQCGSLAKTYLDLFESHLTKYLKVSSRKGTKQGHTLSRLVSAEHSSKVNELPLWPRPTTGAPLCGGTHNFKQMQVLEQKGIITEEERRNLTQGNGGNSNPALMEWLMGFPTGWTDLSASETL